MKTVVGHCCLLLTLWLWLPQLSIEQPDLNKFQLLTMPDRGNLPLHLEPPEIMYEHKGKLYMPVFQALFAPTDVTEGHIPNENHKDIWQDKNKNIILKPNRGDPIWVGMTNPRHQIDFAYRYKATDNNARPRIREFLVPASVFQKITDKRFMTTDQYAQNNGMSQNVDRYLPNQFGFTKEDLELLRQNAVPGTLTTYVMDHNEGDNWSSHEGKKKSFDELRQIYRLPDIPGSEFFIGPAWQGLEISLAQIKERTEKIENHMEKFNQKKPESSPRLEKLHIEESDFEKMFNKDLDGRLKDHLSKINNDYPKLKEKQEQFIEKIKTNLIKNLLKGQEMEEKANLEMREQYINEVEIQLKNKMKGLADLSDWVQEAKKRVKYDSDYKAKNDLGKTVTIEMNDPRIKPIKEYSAFKGSQFPIEFMDNMVNQMKVNAKKLTERRKVIQKVNAIYKYFTRDQVLHAEMKRNGLKSADDMLQYAWPKTLPSSLTAQEKIKAFKLGFLEDFNDNFDSDKVLDHIDGQTDDSHRCRHALSEIDFSSRKISITLPENDDSLPIIVVGKDSEIEVQCAPEKLKKLMPVLKNSFVPHDGNYGLKSLVFKLDIELSSGDIKIKHLLHFVDDLGTVFKDQIKIGKNLKYDQISNKMFQNINGLFEELGIPRIIEVGKCLFNGNRVNREVQEKLNKDKAFTDIPSEKTGIVYSSKGSADTITDILYRKIGQMKPSKFQKEIIVQVGTSDEVEKASLFLYKQYKYKEDALLMKIKIENDQFSMDESIGNKGLILNMDTETRLTVVGHGDRYGNKIKVENVDAATLINKIMNHALGTNAGQERLSIGPGKISLVACTNAESVRDGNMLQQFGKEVIRVLTDYGMSPDISIRVGLVQVDASGHKQYSIDAVGMEWHYIDEKKRIKFKLDNEDKIKYYVNNEWTETRPEIKEVSKLVLVTRSDGEVPLDNVYQKRTVVSLNEIVSGVLGKSLDIPGDLELVQSLNTEVNEKNMYLAIEDGEQPQVRPHDVDGIQASITELEINQWMPRLMKANDDAVQHLPDPDKWIPLIDSAEKLPSDQTKVILINVETKERTFVKMKNDEYVQFKRRTRSHAMWKHSLPSFSKTSIGMTGTGSLMGVGFFIQAIIQMARAKDCKEEGTCAKTKEGQRLIKSMEIQSYINLAEGAFGTVTDSIQIAELAVAFKAGRKSVNGIVTMSSKISKFIKISNVVGKIGMGVGAVGSAVGLGFSAFQLHHAQTKAQEIQFGIQVAVDSLNFAVTGVAIGANIAAAITSSALASSIASVAGPVGFVVAIVGVLITTITSLAFEFSDTRKNAAMVGEYFYDLDDIYSKGGFEYDPETQTLTILQNAIVKIIDTTDCRLILDSQYIYRTKHGWSGSGYRNYFLFHWHFPKMVTDKNKAINIREGIGYRSSHQYFGRKNITNIVLPIVPKSYISYEYSRLPFCTTFKDKGFNIIRLLEKDKRFDYDFYIVPGEQIIAKISHEYVNTSVRVRINEGVKNIIVPPVPPFLQNFYTYSIESSGSKHQVVLTDGVNVKLRNSGSRNIAWFIDARNISDPTVSFLDAGHVKLNSTRIQLEKESDTLYLNDRYGVSLVNPFRKIYSLLSVTKPLNASAVDLRQYLRQMARYVSSQELITINDFELDGKYIGRVFYETAKDRYLFSDFQEADISSDFKSNVTLLGKIEENVYFMSEEDRKAVVWRAHAHNHSIAAIYNLFCGNQTFGVKKLYVQEGGVFIIQKVQEVGFIYRILPDEVMLISIDGPKENIYKLGQLCFSSLIEFLPKYERMVSVKNKFPGECIYPITYPVLPLKQTTPDGETQHFWFYMNDTTTYEYTQDEMFCKASLPPIAHGIIAPNILNECADLTLRHITSLSTGDKGYFFFCEQSKTLLFQVETSAASHVSVPGGIKRIEDFGVGKFILSNNGGLYIFTETGNISLTALTFSAFGQYQSRTDVIDEMTNYTMYENFIAVLNMTDTEGKVMTAWYDVSDERLVIVATDLEVDNVVYLGPTVHANLAWLYDQTTRAVILQQILTDQEIENRLLRTDHSLIWKAGSGPHGSIIASDLDSVEYSQGRVFCVNSQGVMFSLDHFGEINLLGVNQSWVQRNQKDLDGALTDVCIKFQATGLIAMGHVQTHDETLLHRWFHCDWWRMIILSLPLNQDPMFLGQNSREQTLYFVAGKSIKELEGNASGGIVSREKRSIAVHFAKTNGKTLTLQLNPSTPLTFIPILDGKISLVVSTADDSVIQIATDVWMHYKTIVLTGIGSAGLQKSCVQIDAPIPCLYRLEVIDGDTVFFDDLSDHVTILEDFTLQDNQTLNASNSSKNQAVMEFSMCTADKMLFVTSRERLEKLSFTKDEPNLNFWPLFFFGTALVMLCIFGTTLAWACRKRTPSRRSTDLRVQTLQVTSESSV